MTKSTYQNIVTVPGSSTDTVNDGQNIGGDIVTNFKSLADKIHPDGTGALAVGATHSNLEDIYASSEYHAEAQGLHIINNNILGYANGDALDSTSYVDDGSSLYSVQTAGVGSGAFSKGILLRQIYGSRRLIAVPYAGAMVAHYDIIAFDGSLLSVTTGTVKVFPTGVEGDYITDFGEFSVSDGDLYFCTSSTYTAVQIGLHGTILAGASYELNSWQSGNESLGSGYSS